MKKTAWSKLKETIDQTIEFSDPCEDHQEPNMTRLQYEDWAELKLKKGHKQKQCDRCGYFFFKCEY